MSERVKKFYHDKATENIVQAVMKAHSGDVKASEHHLAQAQRWAKIHADHIRTEESNPTEAADYQAAFQFHFDNIKQKIEQARAGKLAKAEPSSDMPIQPHAKFGELSVSNQMKALKTYPMGEMHEHEYPVDEKGDLHTSMKRRLIAQSPKDKQSPPQASGNLVAAKPPSMTVGTPVHVVLDDLKNQFGTIIHSHSDHPDKVAVAVGSKDHEVIYTDPARVAVHKPEDLKEKTLHARHLVRLNRAPRLKY
jgi:hypothetical protein